MEVAKAEASRSEFSHRWPSFCRTDGTFLTWQLTSRDDSKKIILNWASDMEIVELEAFALGVEATSKEHIHLDQPNLVERLSSRNLVEVPTTMGNKGYRRKVAKCR